MTARPSGRDDIARLPAIVGAYECMAIDADAESGLAALSLPPPAA